MEKNRKAPVLRVENQKNLEKMNPQTRGFNVLEA
jgi:hypothetical protein